MRNSDIRTLDVKMLTIVVVSRIISTTGRLIVFLVVIRISKLADFLLLVPGHRCSACQAIRKTTGG
jgi:hypothetical protein